MQEATVELINDKMFFDILLGLDIINRDWHDGKYYFSSLDEEGWRKCFQKICLEICLLSKAFIHTTHKNVKAFVCKTLSCRVN